MVCKKCQKEVDDAVIYCPFCGTQLKSNVIDIVEEKQEQPERGPYKNFAKVGSILGKVSISTFWFLPIGLACGITGIVFSCLGKKSKKNKEMADVAFSRNLTATILSVGLITLIYTIVTIVHLFG